MSPYSITREDAAKDHAALGYALSAITEYGGTSLETRERLQELADSIEEQLPAPIPEEPTGDGAAVYIDGHGFWKSNGHGAWTQPTKNVKDWPQLVAMARDTRRPDQLTATREKLTEALRDVFSADEKPPTWAEAAAALLASGVVQEAPAQLDAFGEPPSRQTPLPNRCPNCKAAYPDDTDPAAHVDCSPQSVPVVDVAAVAVAIRESDIAAGRYVADPEVYEARASALLAAGVFKTEAEVRADELEKLAFKYSAAVGPGGLFDSLTRRAAAIRAGEQ